MAARHRRWFMSAAMAACAIRSAFGGATAAASVTDRFIALATDAGGYSARMETHEEMGDRSDDAIYAFVREPSGERSIRVIEGRGAGYTIADAGLGRHARSLRGNDLAALDLATLAACMRDHPRDVRESAGPTVEGMRTISLVFARAGVRCPADADADRALTSDILDASATGEPILRKRYVGNRVVERVRYRAFSQPADASRR